MACLLSSFHTYSLYGSTISSSRIAAAKPRAVLTRSNQMQVPYDLKQGQSRIFHRLPSGLSMEVLVQKKELEQRRKDKNTENPPLVFVHGSYHAAWCWAEHWLPFFSASGYDCYAISLLGQGESDAPSGSVAGTLETHARDVADFINKNIESPAVLLGHSFGGLIIQYYIAALSSDQLSEMKNLYPMLKGAALVCSVPPSGNSGLVWRYLFSKPIAAFKVTRSLAAKAFQSSLSLCRETFFSATMEDHIVKRYQELMKESSRMPLFDLRKLNASLPVPKASNCPLDILVLGAKDDFIVDAEGLKETASFYGVSPVFVEAIAHDMMLDISWEKGAKVILSWLNGLDKNA
ncbi:chloride peroxidase [Senna tora]|uniref:Chloride peroxidase n=1 Tax=Senna tora TaxID=362788 RepID=A0A834TD95_9FABA|nr:chloride peroxidase [Senna tora]